MELELGLKLTKVVDDFAAAEILIAKDRAGPFFLCKQTDHIFFLTVYLKGYRRENIKIDINEDGSRIVISGEKPVQEMVMVGWKVVKKETAMRGFRKVFKIPGGVILDEVKAGFDEDESILTISMPKLIKGVTGVGIEELREEEMPRGETESLQVVADHDTESKALQVEECTEPMGVEGKENDETVQDLPEFPEQTQLKREREEVEKLAPTKVEMAGSKYLEMDKLEGEKGRGFREKTEKESKEIKTIDAARVEPDQVTQQKGIPPVLEEPRLPDGAPRLETESQDKGTQTEDITRDIQEQEKPKYDQVEATWLKQPSGEDQVVHGQEVGGTEQGIEGEKEAGSADDEPFLGEKEELHDRSTDKGRRRKSKKICAPAIIVGSSLLVSLVVFVIHLIRSKNQTSKKRN